jgi:hypothetical protein
MSTNKGMLNKLYSETQGSHYNSKLVLHSSPSVPGRLIRYHVFMDHLYSKIPSNSYLHPFTTLFSTPSATISVPHSLDVHHGNPVPTLILGPDLWPLCLPIVFLFSSPPHFTGTNNSWRQLQVVELCRTWAKTTILIVCWDKQRPALWDPHGIVTPSAQHKFLKAWQLTLLSLLSSITIADGSLLSWSSLIIPWQVTHVGAITTQNVSLIPG